MHDKLYSATYSNVPVYEFIHPKSSVMRRKHDGWVNATHILKVANFPKAKRTRILEKDVQTGIHEKVQGGYGKYQGTWVPLDRAIEIAKLFNVLSELDPIFNYQSNGPETPPPAPKHHHASNANNKSKKVTTKKSTNQVPASPTPKSKKQQKVPAVTSKRKLNAKSATPVITTKRTLKAPKLSPNSTPTVSSLVPNSLQQFASSSVPASFQHQTSLIQQQSPYQYNSQPHSNLIHDLDDDNDDDLDDVHIDDEDKLRSQRTPTVSMKESFYRRMHEPSTVEFMSENDIDKALAESETYGNNASIQQSIPTSLPQSSLNSNNQEIDRSYAKILYQYFIELDANPNCEIPQFLFSSDFNINQSIDMDGNTCLHWACSMGAIKLIEILINKTNCNLNLLNNNNEIPIIKSIKYANNFNKRTFNKLLDLLISSLLNVDLNERTILHHIALTTSNADNLLCSRYYTEIVLRKIAESIKSTEKFKEFINTQDINGNTALHIFCFNNAQKCIKILLSYNAKIDIRNDKNEQASDYLYNNNNAFNFESLNENHNISTNNYESFNLRPFVVENEGGTPAQFSRNSYYNYHNDQLYQPTIYHPVSAANSITRNSLTSSKFNSYSYDLNNKLIELSNSIEYEIIQKNDDIKQLNLIVEQMNNDLDKTSFEFNETLRNENCLNLPEIENKAHSLSDEYNEKCKLLKKIIDRSQAMDLAKIVKNFEDETISNLAKSENYSSNFEISNLSHSTLLKILKLVKLQILRKYSVDSLISLYSKASDFEDSDKINNYRRLVSKLSNMPINEVDSSLNNIEECLKRDSISPQPQSTNE